MDRVIVKKRFTWKKFFVAAGITALILLVGGSLVLSSGKSRLNVNAERITVSEVKNGPFQEFIPVNGVVMPIATIYLDALEGGRVEEKLAEDGAILKKGQHILRLSNTDLELSLVNQETSVFNLLTQMRISKNGARQNTIAKLNQMAEVENAYKETERIFNLNKSLYEQKVISLQEFKQSENAYEYQVKRKKLTAEILNQDSLSTKEELDQTTESYKRMQNALVLMRRKVNDLVVKAPLDGQLTSLDAEIGQNKNKGERLGQIDALSGFKIRADIDEHYISRIYPGLSGECIVAGKNYVLKIRKVYTQVKGGHFQVDMDFDKGGAPQGIRRGQTLQIRLALSDETHALLVPRGGFYQQTGGNWIFKLSDDGKTAYRCDIQLGRQNPDYYEVLQGLKPGDKVITSGYDNYEKIQELVIKAGQE